MRGHTIRNRVIVQDGSLQLYTWRIRLVGRGRTIGNRVTGNTVPEFESLILRQQKRQVLCLSFFVGYESSFELLLRGSATKR